MMKILAALALCLLLVPSTGCPKTDAVIEKVEPIVNGVIGCAKAESAAIGKQVSVAQLTLDVGGAVLSAVLAGGDTVLDSVGGACDERFGIVAERQR